MYDINILDFVGYIVILFLISKFLPKYYVSSLLNIYTFFNNKWHFDYIYNSYVVKPVFYWGHRVSYKQLDRGVIEYLGPEGVTMLINKLAVSLSRLQSGHLYNYAFVIFVSATVLLLFINNWVLLNVEIYWLIPILILIFNL